MDNENYWELSPIDKALIMAKSRVNRLKFAVLFVFFRDRRQFPRNESEIDQNWIKELASRLSLEEELEGGPGFVTYAPE